ncbi:MAG TPA: glycine cleavage system aminomethyltransferase GcvT [Pseudoclavibacter sp.]|nr:glycine cleavage system aminomethyltransferase GcvT [Pseudoclavibacter sp.]
MSVSADPSSPRVSPLDAVHREAGAAFTEFGGWRMPVRYSSDLAEHKAVRMAAGLFDISHMAEFDVNGPESAAFLDNACAGVISAVTPGRAKYSLLLAPDGGIIDDLIIYARDPEQWLVVANAANHDAVALALTERSRGFAVQVTDRTDDTAMLALQGPRALDILESTDISPVASAAGREPVGSFAQLRYYSGQDAVWGDIPLFVARTGYTGEDGFELYMPVEAAEQVWRGLVAAGADRGLALCGLACRDTLRLEAGMPLYGHELTRETLPRQAGLARVVAPEGSVYVGSTAIDADRAHPDPDRPVLVGLTGMGRRAARAGYEVYATPEDADPAGTITSGALSPTLGHPIAMAYVAPASAQEGETVWVDVRGTRQPMSVTALPFYTRPR